MTGGARPDLPADDPGLRFWLTQGMARAAGVRLAGALAEGRIGLAAYRQILADCSACRAGAACLDWLARPSPSPLPPPGFCAIGGALAVLGPGGGAASGSPANPV